MSILYTLIARDAAGKDEARASQRDGHLAYFAQISEHLALAGPMFDAAGTPSGSLVIVEADSADAALELLKGDPFFAAGIWSDIEVIPFKAASGKLLPRS
jgi:uncharacterized protein